MICRVLKDINDDAEKLGNHGFLLRCLRSGKDADLLTEFQDRIKSATEVFMVSVLLMPSDSSEWMFNSVGKSSYCREGCE